MARRIQRSLTGLLLGAAAAAAPPPEGAALLQKAAAAVRENRREAVFFVFQERVVHREWDRAGALTSEGETGYEVLMIEGEPYHRRVSRNGRPLSEAERAEEDLRLRQTADFRRKTPLEERRKRFAAAERARLRFDVRTLAENHLARFDGESACPTGPCLALSVWPKPKAPKPKHPYEWTLALRGHLWLDRETLHPVRAAMEQTIDFYGQPAGSRTVFDYGRVDGVWLIHRILSEVPASRREQTARRETVQEYSQYQRFQAESVLVFRDVP